MVVTLYFECQINILPSVPGTNESIGRLTHAHFVNASGGGPGTRKLRMTFRFTRVDWQTSISYVETGYQPSAQTTVHNHSTFTIQKTYFHDACFFATHHHPVLYYQALHKSTYIPGTTPPTVISKSVTDAITTRKCLLRKWRSRWSSADGVTKDRTTCCLTLCLS